MLLHTFLLSLLATSTMPDITDVPASVLTPLHEAQTTHERAGMCLESLPRPALEPRYRALGIRMYDAAASARGLWAKQVDRELVDDEPLPSCSTAAIGQALDRTASALDAFDRAFAATTAPLRSGVWVGMLKVCGARTLSATIDLDSYTKRPALTIKLDAEATTRLAMLTRRATGDPMAVRLDGVVVMQPTVFEPILHGTLQLNGPDADVLERLRRALDRPC